MPEEQAVKHSVKVPRLYKCASKLYKKLEKEDFKNYTASTLAVKHPNKKAITALLYSANTHQAEIDRLYVESGLKEASKNADPYLMKILMAELLFGKRTLPSVSTPLETVLKFKEKFHELLGIEVQSNKKNPDIKCPKYVRVNTIKAKYSQIIEKLRKKGWKFISYDKDNTSLDKFHTMVKALKFDEFLADYHVDNLLVFHGKSEWFKNPLQLNGTLILQNKASCLATLALNPEPGSIIIDACAAPGMKTSHLAAVLEKNCTIHAFDKSKERCKSLTELVSKFGIDSCVKTKNIDFTDVAIEDYSDVDYIMLDPSCSGSGMVRRKDEEYTKSRLIPLQSMQKALLRHALSFPNVKKVVYSTCSYTIEENEEVVEAIYTEVEDRFSFERVLPNWETRGVDSFAHHEEFVRTDPNKHLCNGFFIALFSKREQ